VTTSRLRDAYRYCNWITHRHYENFPVASWLLPKKIQPHVAAVYAFARSADDFADEARYEGRSLELLEQWRQALRGCNNGTRDEGRGTLSSHPIFVALADTIHRHDLPVQLLDDLLSAFRMDVTKRRYSDWEDLLTYCRYSANPVGRLVLALFGIRDPQLYEYSDHICTALQLANHWQDLGIDVARDMVYVPKTLMDQHGVTEKELLQAGQSPSGTVPGGGAFRSLMKDLVRRARLLFDAGEPLVKALRGGLQFEIKFTLAGGRAILDRIEAADYDVFRHRPALSSWSKLQLLTHALVSR